MNGKENRSVIYLMSGRANTSTAWPRRNGHHADHSIRERGVVDSIYGGLAYTTIASYSQKGASIFAGETKERLRFENWNPDAGYEFP
jgi:hypothetical protein